MTTIRKKAIAKARAKPVRKPAAKRPAQAKPKTVAAETPKRTGPKNDYVYAVGRRKSAVARVRVYRKGDGLTVNDKVLAEYFPMAKLQGIVQLPLTLTNIARGQISVRVLGGGVRSQAESIRLGIARALLLLDPESRATLKHAGLLRRDARVKERKKYGLKRARRAPQWQKR